MRLARALSIEGVVEGDPRARPQRDATKSDF
jgi:hypothetical protein